MEVKIQNSAMNKLINYKTVPVLDISWRGPVMDLSLPPTHQLFATWFEIVPH